MSLQLRPASSQTPMPTPEGPRRVEKEPSKIPDLVNGFFQIICGSAPVEVQGAKKEMTYTVPKLGVSFATNKHKGGIILLTHDLSPELLVKVKQAASRTIIQSQKNEKAKTSSYFRSFSFAVNRSSKPAKDVALMLKAEPEMLTEASENQFRDLYDKPNNRNLRMFWVSTEEEPNLPSAATHNVGATAVLIDRVALSVLLVVNQSRDKWCFPGGAYDPLRDKNDKETALNELAEETGNTVKDFLFDPARMIPSKDDPSKLVPEKVEPSLVGRMDFEENPLCGALNFPWLFDLPGIKDRIKLNPPPREIKRAEWIGFKEISEAFEKVQEKQAIENERAKASGEKPKTIKIKVRGVGVADAVISNLKTAINGLGFKKAVDKGWLINYTSVKQ